MLINLFRLATKWIPRCNPLVTDSSVGTSQAAERCEPARRWDPAHGGREDRRRGRRVRWRLGAGRASRESGGRPADKVDARATSRLSNGRPAVSSAAGPRNEPWDSKARFNPSLQPDVTAASSFKTYALAGSLSLRHSRRQEQAARKEITFRTASTGRT